MKLPQPRPTSATAATATDNSFTGTPEQMEALMFNASVGILITKDRKMIRYNPMFAQMFGFTGQAGIGHPAIELYRSEPEYAALGAQAAPLLSQGKPFQAELYMRRQDGCDIWVNLIGYVADLHDTSRATFWILEDRTAFKAAETALLQAQRDLAQAEKLAALGALVVGVAHELNTPLGNALTAASTLHDQSRDLLDAIAGEGLRRSQLTQFLDNLGGLSRIVLTSCERAAQLVTGFKQVAVSRREEERVRFVLGDVLDQTVFVQQRTLATHHPGIQISCTAPSNLVCEGYPQALDELLTNLLENALTHAFGGRSEGHVQITADATADWVALRVRDDGNGMDEATLARIFDPYFTTRLGQGRSGLGLSISRNLASAILGGELSAESQPGHGSCFTLRFPRTVPKTQAAA